MGPEQVLAWYLKAALLVLEARSPQSSCDQTGFLLRAGEGRSEPAGGGAAGELCLSCPGPPPEGKGSMLGMAISGPVA